jgi:excisionase family DNA binding protein
MPNEPTLIGTTETAKLLGKSPRTVHRLVQAGRLRPAMVAPGGYVGTFLFDRADVEALVSEQGAA